MVIAASLWVGFVNELLRAQEVWTRKRQVAEDEAPDFDYGLDGVKVGARWGWVPKETVRAIICGRGRKERVEMKGAGHHRLPESVAHDDSDYTLGRRLEDFRYIINEKRN